jgi:hypothetical protein
MVTRSDPHPLARRLRRLELLFSTLLLSLEEDRGDEDLWHELHRLFRYNRDFNSYDFPELELFFDRLQRRRQQQQPHSLFRQVERLEREIVELNSKSSALQADTHSLLALQALGLPSDRIQSIRFVPVRAYIDQTPDGAIADLSAAIGEVLSAYGFTLADEFPEIKGSWFKKWFAKSKEVLSRPEVMERLEKIERAVELKAVYKPQADVDDKQASAIAKLIKCLDKVPNAAVQAGSVLVVKLTTPNGPIIQARTLSQDELIELENNQLLLQNPADVLGKLNAACASAKRLPRPKSSGGRGD